MATSKRYRVSSKGLTRCPECARHIFLAADWKTTNCEFCGAHLIAGPAPTSHFLLDKIRNGRSGLVAAGLISMSLAGPGCVDDHQPDPSDQGVMMSGPDQMMGQPQPAYGGSPEEDAAFDVDAGLDAAPEPMPQPEYGGPPEIDAGLGSDAHVDAAPEPTPQPEYGAPPAPDAGQSEDAELDAAPEPLPQPEYGGPPDDNE